MVIPLSLQDNFFNLGQQSYHQIINKDYNNNKHKAIFNTKKGTNIQYSYWLVPSQHNHSSRFRDTLKVGVLSFDQFYTQFIVDRIGNIKYHIDLGTRTVYSEKTNYYFQLKCNSNLQNQWWRFGKTAVVDKTQFHARFEYLPSKDWVMSHKVLHDNRRLQFGIATLYSFKYWKFTKCDWLLGYRLRVDDELNIVLKHQTITKNDKKQQQAIRMGKLMFGISYQFCKGFSTAVYGYRNYLKDKNRVVIGIEKKTKNQMCFKAKVDSNTKTSLYYRAKVNDIISGSVNFQFNCKQIPQSSKVGIYIQTTL